MEYLKLFTQHSDYEEFITGGGVNLPNVSYCEKENEIHYYQYQTIEYTSTDGNIVSPSPYSTMPFIDINGKNIKIISNTYENGKGIIKLEKECGNIYRNAFYSCDNLASITIPGSVKAIIDYAFSGCSNLSSINLENGIKSIGEEAFASTAITNITIPDSVVYLYNEVFSNCRNLSSITINPIIPPTNGTNMFENIDQNAKIYVPSASLDVYKNADGWSKYADIIQAIPE